MSTEDYNVKCRTNNNIYVRNPVAGGSSIQHKHKILHIKINFFLIKMKKRMKSKSTSCMRLH